MIKNHLILIGLILAILGCSLKDLSGTKKITPAKSASTYYKLLKWKYFDRAAQMVDIEKREQYENFVTRNEDKLNITEFEIKEVIYNENESECVVRVYVKYYKYPSVSEETADIDDKWILLEENWFISSDFDDEIFK